MQFTTGFDGVMSIDFSRSVFNIININDDFRSNVYFLLNSLVFVVLFYKQAGVVFRLAFFIACEKFIYKFGMLLHLYEFNDGWSDILGVVAIITFLIFESSYGGFFKIYFSKIRTILSVFNVF